MGVFCNENAAARPFRDTQQQGKCSNCSVNHSVCSFVFDARSISLWMLCRAFASMDVFRNENAAARSFRDTQQQGNALG